MEACYDAPRRDYRYGGRYRLSSGDHRHNAGLHHVIKTVEVGVDNVVPVAVAKRREGGVARNTRVADDAIPGAVLRHIGFKRLSARLTLAHVETEQTACAACLDNLAQRLLRGRALPPLAKPGTAWRSV